jgi:hypothetical protein
MTRSRGTYAAFASAVAAALVLSAGALAAFVDLGAPAGRASGVQWRVRLGAPSWSGSLTALYPGAADDIEYIPFVVTNGGQGTEKLRSVAVSIRGAPNGDAETAAGARIPGCLASWFVVSIESRGAGPPDALSPGGSYTSKLAVTVKDSGTDQDACRSVSPAVIVTAR